MPDVVVLGCGGIGLPVAVALAGRGAPILGIDVDAARVADLSAGHTSMTDDGLAAALRSALDRGSLHFATDLGRSGARRSYIIAVPTAVDAQHRLIRGPLDDAMARVLAVAAPGDLVVIRSTTPVGTLRTLAAHRAARPLLFASCPDRTVAGRGLAEQFTIPHIVGGLTPGAAGAARDLFSLLGPVRVVSSPEAAEAIKLFANVWRDATFAIANQFALFCDAAGLDLAELREAGAEGFARFDLPRPGPVGGPCLTKDVFLLEDAARSCGVDLALLRAARAANDDLVTHIARHLAAESDRAPPPAVMAILGLAFKGSPPTLDRRGSFGVALAARVGTLRPALTVRQWDPASDPDLAAGCAATAGAHIVVLANDHALLAAPRLLDTCAPGALVYDVCGVLAGRGALRPDLRIARFGSGGAALR